jgi:hypothetical protein
MESPFRPTVVPRHDAPVSAIPHVHREGRNPLSDRDALEATLLNSLPAATLRLFPPCRRFPPSNGSTASAELPVPSRASCIGLEGRVWEILQRLIDPLPELA